MSGGENKGYTIIEVMLFMAISGFMFVVAAIFISGKQAQVEFHQGLTAANATVRTVVNEVANGEYDPLGNFTCQAPSQNVGAPTFTSGNNNPQGANSGCIFLGKVIQFNPSGNDPTGYAIYTIAARQLDSTDQQPVSSFAAAQPVPVYYNGNGGNTLNLTVDGKLQDGTEATAMLYCDSSGSNCKTIYAFGIFGSFGSYSGVASSGGVSGAQTVVTAWVPLVAPPVPTETAMLNGALAGGLHNITSAEAVSGGSYILICLQNGNKYGTLTIGGSNGQQFTTAAKAGKNQSCPS